MREIVYPVIKQRMLEKVGTRGALVVPTAMVPLVDVKTADLLLIVLCEEKSAHGWLSTFAVDSWRVKELCIEVNRLEKELLLGEREDLIQCILYGDILDDPTYELQAIRRMLRDFPSVWREKKMCIEYARVLEDYLETKDHLKSGYLMDAFAAMQEGLQHWGRLTIIEANCYPEFRLWSQVKLHNPALYKLHHELIYGTDSIEQRVRLVLLAAEYSIISQLTNYASFLLDLIKKEEDTWSVEMLMSRLSMEKVAMDPTLLIEELVKRSVIEEVTTWDQNRTHHRYRYIH
ncbi:nucleotidyltransferase-like protein [Marininema halotolerans]|uniref:Nucleotidyltransferase-like n=1 Tax=Marininema halotolerans TaxID=1155944 RepID=A0A1I6UEG4_9BACL|nr:nucleotidyltransferase-like protein [Marininema halotolerans]SFS99810.1 Nucleotidyltransferase-like [Marininema halotolerans]